MTRIRIALAITVIATAVVIALTFTGSDERPPLCSEPVAAAGAPSGPVVTNCHHTQENDQ